MGKTRLSDLLDAAANAVLADAAPTYDRADEWLGKTVEVNWTGGRYVGEVITIDRYVNHDLADYEREKPGYGYNLRVKLTGVISFDFVTDIDLYSPTIGTVEWFPPLEGQVLTVPPEDAVYPPTKSGRPVIDLLEDEIDQARTGYGPGYSLKKNNILEEWLWYAKRTKAISERPDLRAARSLLIDIGNYAAGKINKKIKELDSKHLEAKDVISRVSFGEAVDTSSSKTAIAVVKQLHDAGLGEDLYEAIGLLSGYTVLSLKREASPEDFYKSPDSPIELFGYDFDTIKMSDGRSASEIMGVNTITQSDIDILEDELAYDIGGDVYVYLYQSRVEFSSKVKWTIAFQPGIELIAKDPKYHEIARKHGNTPTGHEEMRIAFGEPLREKIIKKKIENYKLDLNRSKKNAEVVVIEGFNFVLKDVNPRIDGHKDFIDILKHGMRMFSQRMKRYAPAMLEVMPKWIVEFDEKYPTKFGPAQGTYHQEIKTVRLYYGSIKTTERLCDVAVHECGHHWYRNYLSYEKRVLWEAAFDKYRTRGEVKLEDILARWEKHQVAPESLYKIFSDDPLTYLRIAALQLYERNEGYIKSIDDLRERIQDGETVVKVMFVPVSAYGATNPEEHFCEAISHFVTYGPRSVHPWYGMMLEIMLDDKFRAHAAADVDRPADIWEELDWASSGFLEPDEFGTLVEKYKQAPPLTLSFMDKTYDRYRLMTDDDGVTKLVEFDGKYFTVTDLNEWMSGWDNDSVIEDICSWLAEQFSEEFSEYPAMLYHATDSDNLDSILQDGLMARNSTRGLTNRGVGSAIFTTDDRELVSDSYGDSVLEIDVPAMARDGIKFAVDREPSVYKYEAQDTLASVLGMSDFQPYVENDGANDPSTVILYCTSVAPKYLRVVEDGRSLSSAQTADLVMGLADQVVATADRIYYRVQPKGLGILHRSTYSDDTKSDGLMVFREPWEVLATSEDVSAYGDEVVVISAPRHWYHGDVEGVLVDPDKAKVIQRFSTGEFAKILLTVADGSAPAHGVDSWDEARNRLDEISESLNSNDVRGKFVAILNTWKRRAASAVAAATDEQIRSLVAKYANEIKDIVSTNIKSDEHYDMFQRSGYNKTMNEFHASLADINVDIDRDSGDLNEVWIKDRGYAVHYNVKELNRAVISAMASVYDDSDIRLTRTQVTKAVRRTDMWRIAPAADQQDKSATFSSVVATKHPIPKELWHQLKEDIKSLTDGSIMAVQKALNDASLEFHTEDITIERDLGANSLFVECPPFQWLNAYIDVEKLSAEILRIVERRKKADTEVDIAYKFSDGNFIADLRPEQLERESEELGHCVGDDEQDYTENVENGATKIYSLRTSSNRPKLTIEFDVASRTVIQVRGTGNRLAGWNDANGGGRFKADEVSKVVEWLGKKEGYDLKDVLRTKDIKRAVQHAISLAHASGIPEPTTIDELVLILDKIRDGAIKQPKSILDIKKQQTASAGQHCVWCSRGSSMKTKMINADIFEAIADRVAEAGGVRDWKFHSETPEQTNMPFIATDAPSRALDRLEGDGMAWERLMKKLGVPVGYPEPRFLGGGAHGLVYDFPGTKDGDRVLKLTDDLVEASAAMTLSMKPMDEAYFVYNVYRIKLKGPTRVYALWLERLDPADPLYRNLVVMYLEFLYSSYLPRALTPKVVKSFSAALKVASPRHYKSYEEALDWLMRCARNLVSRGILNRDLHPGNIMKRPNGEHVVIDIGHTSTAPRRALQLASTQTKGD